MKARVKATGEIVEVNEFCALRDSGERTYYWVNALELITQDNPDYWTRLEHQYAGMAMQAYIIASHISQFSFCESDMKGCKSIAHALVEKLKEKEDRK